MIWPTVAGVSVATLDAPTASILLRLTELPQYNRYADQVGAVLALLDRCRARLPNEVAPELCHAAYNQNDAIYQSVSFASPAILADEVRRAAQLDTATDMQAIAAFVLGCCVHALHAIGDCLQGNEPDEIAALDLFRTYLDSISECVQRAGAELSADEYEACNEMERLAYDASKQAGFKADGIWGGLERRGPNGTAARDLEICQKALELFRAGTRFHNLSSKLRAWQQREHGKALSKPAMDAILKRWGLSLSATAAVNQRKK